MAPEPPIRLSVRGNLAQEDGPYEGVPDHLRLGLARWADAFLGAEPVDDPDDDVDVNDYAQREWRLTRILARCRLPALPGAQLPSVVDLIVHRGPPGPGTDDDLLDLVDMHLQLCGGGADELAGLLDHGNSAWTVAPSLLRLERRAPEEQSLLYDAAARSADEASHQLTQAWSKVYGRHPDPSGAWEHAIPAVEALLKPIVSPTDARATLGSMLGALESRPEKWALTLPSSTTTVGPLATLIAMLRLLWPNPDRLGTQSSREPTRTEAEHVVGLALLIVAWLRSGALRLAHRPPDTTP